MTSRRQFWIILFFSLAIPSLISHALVGWLGVHGGGKVTNSVSKTGTQFQGVPILFAGSSMIGVALDKEEVAQEFGRPIYGVAAASGSPAENEILTAEVTNANVLVIGVSEYELDEEFISDFRADIVPIAQTIHDLAHSDEGWPYIKRCLSRYPLYYLRKIFPTAGCSEGVMVGLRAKFLQLLHPESGRRNENLPTLNTVSTDRICDWPAARLLRNLSALHSECQDSHNFNGPKHLAFKRLIQRARQQGKVVVLVLPVSPAYENRLLTETDKQAFEKSLRDIAAFSPETKWIRLDQLPEFHDGTHFSDLVHLNNLGRPVATKAFCARMKNILEEQ